MIAAQCSQPLVCLFFPFSGPDGMILGFRLGETVNLEQIEIGHIRADKLETVEFYRTDVVVSLAVAI